MSRYAVQIDAEHDRRAMESGATSDVPCNGCTLCCQGGDAIRILPGEDASQWATEPHPFVEGALMLAHKRNGDCLYLGDIGQGKLGCTIHGKNPLICRRMDCRVIATKIGFTHARKHPGLNMLVWNKGKQLLKKAKK
jgi:hypothetical protein